MTGDTREHTPMAPDRSASNALERHYLKDPALYVTWTSTCWHTGEAIIYDPRSSKWSNDVDRLKSELGVLEPQPEAG